MLPHLAILHVPEIRLHLRMFTNLDILRKSGVVILPLRLGIRSTHVASGAGRQTPQFGLVMCKYRNSFRLQKRGFNKI